MGGAFKLWKGAGPEHYYSDNVDLAIWPVVMINREKHPTSLLQIRPLCQEHHEWNEQGLIWKEGLNTNLTARDLREIKQRKRNVGPEVRTTWGRIRPRGFGVDSKASLKAQSWGRKAKPFWIKKEGLRLSSSDFSYKDFWPQVEFPRNGRSGIY